MASSREKQPGATSPASVMAAPRRAPTAHDVAALAGVSQSAVSRCFTPGASISEETRQRVQAAAEQLGYRPNLIARSLIKRRSTIIGVVIPGLQNPFYAAMLEALSADLATAGYRILLFNAPARDSPDPVLDEMLNYRVDALILVSSSLSSGLADECQKIGLPVVQLNRTTERSTVSSVVGDNHGGAEAIARFLLACEHERFAFIAGLETSSTGKAREAAFLGTLGAAGKPVARGVANYVFEEAEGIARQMLGGANPPDAIFCASDHMAIAALGVARTEFGLTIGRDISIVGFDDIQMAGWPQISLTTFRQPVRAMSARAVAIIEAQLQGTGTGLSEVVAGDLVVRGSTREPAHGVTDLGYERVWRP